MSPEIRNVFETTSMMDLSSFEYFCINLDLLFTFNPQDRYSDFFQLHCSTFHMKWSSSMTFKRLNFAVHVYDWFIFYSEILNRLGPADMRQFGRILRKGEATPSLAEREFTPEDPILVMDALISILRNPSPWKPLFLVTSAKNGSELGATKSYWTRW